MTTQGDWVFIVPDGWEILQDWGWGYALREIGGGLRVLIDCSVKDDGNLWLHVSYSRKSWIPSHQDTCKVKNVFIGAERYAYAVYPPADRHVNIHPNCLHLWALWNEDGGRVLPEFSAELPVVGLSI